MLLPIYEADIIVMQKESDKRHEEEVQRTQIVTRQNELAQRLQYLNKIIEQAPSAGGYSNKSINISDDDC